MRIEGVEKEYHIKRPILIGVIALQALLMGAAFVGGRMMAGQNQRNAGPMSAAQLPSQLPKEPMAGSGSVQKVQNNIITLSQGGGGPGGGPPGGGGPGGGPGGGGASSSSSSSGLEVSVSSDTKYYKRTSPGGVGMPGGSQTSVQIAEAKLTEIKIGNTLMVWGIQNGQRITAEVIYIQAQSFGP